MKKVFNKRKSVLWFASVLSMGAMIVVPTVTLTSCSQTIDNNKFLPHPEDYQNGTNFNLNVKNEVEIVGSIDDLITENVDQTNNNITFEQKDIQQVWNDSIKNNPSKKNAFFDKELTLQELNTIDVSVTKKPYESKPWVETGKTYTKYTDWSKKVDVEITFEGSAINHDGHQFNIKSIGELKDALKSYQRKGLNNQIISQGIEGILLDSYYVQPKRLDTLKFSYELAESELNIDKNKEYLEIHVLEKLENNIVKDVKLNIPLSDINLIGEYDISVIDKKDDNIFITNKNQTGILTFNLGIDSKAEDTYTKIYVQDPSITDDNTLNNFDLSQVDELDILIDLGFANETNKETYDNKNVKENENSQEENKPIVASLNHNNISKAFNVYNVTWSDPTVIINKPTETNTDYSATVSIWATPTKGHKWEDTNTTESREFKLEKLQMVKSFKTSAYMINNHTTYLNIDTSKAAVTTSQQFLTWWKSTGFNNNMKNIIEQEIGKAYFTNLNIDKYSTCQVKLDAHKHPVITYPNIWPLPANAWQDGTKAMTPRPFEITFNSISLNS